MALIAYPLESGFVGYDEYGEPVFDRAVGSRFYRSFWSKYFTDGVFMEPSDNFIVRPGGGFDVSVKLGECHIQGVTAAPDDEAYEIIRLDPSNAAADRVDRIVLRADFEVERMVSVNVRTDWKPGDTLTRNSNIWELALADVLVKKGANTIEAANITDLRLDEELCGVVTEPIKRTKTKAFFEQLKARMECVENEWNEQLDSQQAGWQLQMDGQDEAGRCLYNKISAWYTDIRLDIANLQIFDFDNIAMLLGCTRRTVFNEDDSIVETLTGTASGKLAAIRETSFSGDGGEIVTTKTTIFKEDGQTVLSEHTGVTTVGGEIIEIFE